jgi:translation initiation factor 1
MKNSQLVFSTDSNNQKCPKCGQLECICSTEKDTPLAGQSAKILIDRKGRKGKSMTVIEGLRVNPMHLAEIAKSIKQKLGTGGTAKNGRIEIQGEHRPKVASILQEMGVKTKNSGG